MTSTIITAVLSVLAAAVAYDASQDYTQDQIPATHQAPPGYDMPAFDWQSHDTAAMTANERTAHTTRQYAPAAKVWTCTAPRSLASDESGTVRVCEYR